MPGEFRVNNYITLRLENNETIIYINNERFRQCKYLVTNIQTSNIDQVLTADSIDQLFEFKGESFFDKNKIDRLPKSIRRLKSLAHFYIDNNSFASIPNFLGDIKTLKELTIDENQLKLLSGDLKEKLKKIVHIRKLI